MANCKDSWPLYKGRAWRVPSGFSEGKTAGDVVRFEQDELGNELGVSKQQLKCLDQYPVRRIVWVTKQKKDALRYGSRSEVEEEYVGRDTKIIAEDGDGGYLVLKGGE